MRKAGRTMNQGKVEELEEINQSCRDHDKQKDIVMRQI